MRIAYKIFKFGRYCQDFSGKVVRAMRCSRAFLAVFGICFTFVLVIAVVGQEALNPFAPPSVTEPLTSASPTGGLSAPTYIERARAVTRPVGPIPPVEGDPRGRPPIFAEGRFFEEGIRGRRPTRSGAPQPGPGQPTPTPTVKKIRVLSGSRVTCAVCGTLLEDTVYKEVPESQKENYYDDGTHGDAEAGDGTYTNITVCSDVMCPACHSILQKLLTLLSITENTEPMDFFRLNVVTTDPLSSLPKQITEEQNRDIKLSEWNDRFLQMFRVNKNDPNSPFYPLYVPPPPSYPSVPLPQGFTPIVAATPTPTEGTGGEFMGPGGRMGTGSTAVMGVEGEGRGGHMGSYYEPGRMRRF